MSCGEEEWCSDSKRVAVNMIGEHLLMFQKHHLLSCRAPFSSILAFSLPKASIFVFHLRYN